MSTSAAPIAKTWTDVNVCPFCEAPLADPGAGFMDHLKTSQNCAVGFDTWRENVSSDIGGTWSG